MTTPSPLLEDLASQARCYVTPAVMAELPQETYRSAHWHRLARVYPFDLCARFEPDDNDPDTGAEQCGLLVTLKSPGGEEICGTSLWAILLPSISADQSAWQSFYQDCAETCRFLIDETCRPEKVRRYLEERYLWSRDLLAATYQQTDLETAARDFASR